MFRFGSVLWVGLPTSGGYQHDKERRGMTRQKKGKERREERREEVEEERREGLMGK